MLSVDTDGEEGAVVVHGDLPLIAVETVGPNLGVLGRLPSGVLSIKANVVDPAGRNDLLIVMKAVGEHHLSETGRIPQGDYKATIGNSSPL